MSDVVGNPEDRFSYNEAQLLSTLFQINASDTDESGSDYSNVRFSFLSTWTSSEHSVFPLTIDDRTGQVNITGLVSPATEYNMVVQACDSPGDENNRYIY